LVFAEPGAGSGANREQTAPRGPGHNPSVGSWCPGAMLPDGDSS
jgi:hypothetical protein